MKTLDPQWLHWPQTQKLVAAFAPQKDSLRFVGGAVRDALVGKEVKDVDAATILLPEATMALLEKAGIKAIPTGIAHGTVTAAIDGKTFEVTTLRRDVQTDGRHAVVAYTDDWKADAARRDFTMNAMYLSPAGELFDYFGGGMDLREGRVKFIGDAAARIAEDYLRILRFFRFHAHYGKGEPDAAALTACAASASHMEGLSGERIQQELFKLLDAPGCFATVTLMHEEKLLISALGFGVRDCAMLSRFEAIAQAAQLEIPAFIKLSTFFCKADIPADKALDRLVQRLRLSNAIADDLQSAMLHYDEVAPLLSVAGQKKKLRKLGAQRFRQAVLVAWAHGGDAIDATHPYNGMLKLAQTWQPPQFPVTGDDLIARGITPGKDMGMLLQRLEDEWEASDYKVSKENLLKTVK